MVRGKDNRTTRCVLKLDGSELEALYKYLGGNLHRSIFTKDTAANLELLTAISNEVWRAYVELHVVNAYRGTGLQAPGVKLESDEPPHSADLVETSGRSTSPSSDEIVDDHTTGASRLSRTAQKRDNRIGELKFQLEQSAADFECQVISLLEDAQEEVSDEGGSTTSNGSSPVPSMSPRLPVASRLPNGFGTSAYVWATYSEPSR